MYRILELNPQLYDFSGDIDLRMSMYSRRRQSFRNRKNRTDWTLKAIMLVQMGQKQAEGADKRKKYTEATKQPSACCKFAHCLHLLLIKNFQY